MSNIVVDLDKPIFDFFSIFNTVISSLRSIQFVIGGIKFDLFTLAISLLAFNVVWFFVSSLIWNGD